MAGAAGAADAREPVMYRLNGARRRGRLVGLDYDHTLVVPKSGGTFARNLADWRWYSPTVPEQLRRWYAAGYMLVIFTNQTKDFKIAQIREVLEATGIPMFVCIGIDKATRKPERVLWEMFEAWVRGGAVPVWKLGASIFVGDALGRPGDWSDTDRLFAERVGFGKIMGPEDVFGGSRSTSATPMANPRDVWIMVGPPGSGKSTAAAGLAGDKMTVIHGDEYKTAAKMLAAAAAVVAADPDRGIIFDATHPSKASREPYIRFAQERGRPVKCAVMTTPVDVAAARNRARERPIPDVAYAVFRKRYEPPEESEGCEVVRLGT